MSDAIDNADVMIYAVSTLYKESGNCRLEANYAHQVRLLSLCAPPSLYVCVQPQLILLTRCLVLCLSTIPSTWLLIDRSIG